MFIKKSTLVTLCILSFGLLVIGCGLEEENPDYQDQDEVNQLGKYESIVDNGKCTPQCNQAQGYQCTKRNCTLGFINCKYVCQKYEEQIENRGCVKKDTCKAETEFCQKRSPKKEYGKTILDGFCQHKDMYLGCMASNGKESATPHSAANSNCGFAEMCVVDTYNTRRVDWTRDVHFMKKAYHCRSIKDKDAGFKVCDPGNATAGLFPKCPSGHDCVKTTFNNKNGSKTIGRCMSVDDPNNPRNGGSAQSNSSSTPSNNSNTESDDVCGGYKISCQTNCAGEWLGSTGVQPKKEYNPTLYQCCYNVKVAKSCSDVSKYGKAKY